jgi:hypothetical protein
VGGARNPDPMAFAQFTAIQIAVTLPLTYFLAPKWMRGSVELHGFENVDDQPARG